MHAFDPEGRIKKYETPEQITQEFYDVRIKYYEKRKNYLIDKLGREVRKLDNKTRFILMVVDGKLIVSKRKKADLLKELVALKFDPFDKEEVVENEEEPNEEKEATSAQYNYLLSMPLWNLTYEKVEDLKAEKQKKKLNWILLQKLKLLKCTVEISIRSQMH